MAETGLTLEIGAGMSLASLRSAYERSCRIAISGDALSAIDRGAKTIADIVARGDTVYGVAEISNASEKLKVTARLFADDVQGLPSGAIPGGEVSVDLPGSGTATFNFKGPGGSWPPGKYKIEVSMLNEEGEQKDQKSASFTVS